MIVREVQAKSILNASKVYPYVINPYTGCQHGCSYCYARFMKRFTGHREPWGEFVDVKVNAVELLSREVVRKRPGRVWVSGVCDPYQPVEAQYRLTRGCLEVLAEQDWPVTVQTRSPLVLRDRDVFLRLKQGEVGLTITTADDDIRAILEPNAPPIAERARALAELHAAGIRTYVMIAPMLPGAEGLPALLAGTVDRVLLDRLNYHYADRVYRENGLDDALSDGFFVAMEAKLRAEFAAQGVPC
ncbi:MAG: radical SAM protein [Anaerolineales bacterium]